MDYLDAMIEARNKELSLWSYTYSTNDDKYLVYRNGFVVDAFEHLEIDAGFNLRRDRAAMKAAYEAAQACHWGNAPEKAADLNEESLAEFIAELNGLKSGSGLGLQRLLLDDPKPIHEFTPPAMVPVEGKLGIAENLTAETLKKGIEVLAAQPVRAMYVPAPKLKEETQAERIARVTREMCGG